MISSAAQSTAQYMGYGTYLCNNLRNLLIHKYILKNTESNNNSWCVRPVVMLGKVGGWVVIEGLAHTELWVEYNLPYVNWCDTFVDFKTSCS